MIMPIFWNRYGVYELEWKFQSDGVWHIFTDFYSLTTA